jgi:hypothetical protein
LVAAAAAGAVAVGTGTAYAEGIFKAPSDKDCTYNLDKDKPQKETDFPSSHEEEADSNARRNDLRDSHGDVYYTHNESCDAPRPWRGWDWHDKSYDTFHYKTDPRTGYPSQDHDRNTFADHDGYNGAYRKDKERHLERDHVGAPKNPKYATE